MTENYAWAITVGRRAALAYRKKMGMPEPQQPTGVRIGRPAPPKGSVWLADVISEIARRKGITPEAVRKAMRKGRIVIPTVHLGGTKYVVSSADADRIIGETKDCKAMISRLTHHGEPIADKWRTETKEARVD